MAERCALFVIIALGESVLVTGATFAGLTWTAEHIGAFLVAFTGSVAMWVIYFNIGAERAQPPDRVVQRSRPPGAQRLHLSPHPDRGGHHRRRGRRRSGAASSRRPQRHRDRRGADRRAGALSRSAICCSSGCRRRTCRCRIWSGLRLLALLIPAVPVTTPLLLSSATTAVLIVVAAWESISLRQSPHDRRRLRNDDGERLGREPRRDIRPRGCGRNRRNDVRFVDANRARIAASGTASSPAESSAPRTGRDGCDHRRQLADFIAVLTPDRLRRHRDHLRRAVALKRGDLDAGDLHLVAARADQDRRAGSSP